MYHIDLSKIPFDGPYYFQELEQQYIREHDHAFYEIAVIMSGRGWHASGEQLLRVQEGDVFIIPVGTPHCWVRNSQLRLLNIYYKRSGLLSMIDNTAHPFQPVFFAGNTETAKLRSAIHMRVSRETLQEVRRELHQFNLSDGLGETYRIGCFLKVLAYLQREYGSYYGLDGTQFRSLRPAVYRLMEALDQYALTGEHFNLGVEAARHGMSAEHVSRLFREALAVSPYKFFNRRRLLHAEDLLRSTNKTCTEIAHELGYSDAAHFSRTFREHHGITPAEWRRQRGSRSMAVSSADAATGQSGIA